MINQSRVLIVDDMAVNRTTLSCHLSPLGVDIHEVDGGVAALDAIEKESWDLVLLDIMMPDLNGLEVLKQVRQTFNETELPIIMISAKDNASRIQKAMDLGANDYITKPIDYLVAMFRIKAQLRLKQAVAQIKELSAQQFQDEAARVSAIFNHVEVAIFNIDLDGRILSANPGAALVFRFESQEVIGQNIDKFIPALLSSDSKTAIDLGSRNHALKIPGLTTAGDELWLDVSVSRLNQSNQSTWIVIVKDVTLEVAANRMLIESEARLRLAMAASSDGIWDWDLKTKHIYFSDTWFTMLGYTPENWSGNYENWTSYILEDDRAEVERAIQYFIEQRIQRFSIEYSLIHKDGHQVPVLSRGFLQKDELTGQPIRFIGTHVDLTTQKHFENQLKRMNSDLEETIADRTRELRSALTLAEASSKSKSDFLSMMSHEIRTPLHAIIGMSQLALKGNLSARQNHYVSQSYKAGLTLLDLLDDILDFSKIESDKLELEQTSFELEDIFKRLSASTSYSAHTKGLEYLFDIDPLTLRSYRGDPTRLGQILINFVGNAIKFTEEGEIVVQTTLVEQVENVHIIEINVIDSGVGMTTQQQKRLFIPFSQGDMSITRLYGGTGLGLAICHKLIELMGGAISFESQKGEGTTFSVRIPLPLAEIKEKERPSWTGLERETPKILIVESSPSSRSILLKATQHFGFAPHTCNSGIEAVEKVRLAHAQEQSYDLLIMGWKMPGLDGLETAAVIERMNSPKPTKICMLVPTNCLEEFEVQRRSLQMASVVPKPYNYSDLWAGIAKALSDSTPQAVDPETKYLTLFHEISGARILLVEDHEVNQELALDFLELVNAEVEIANNGQEAIEILKDRSFDLVLMDLHMPVMDGFTATKHIRQELKLVELPIIAMTAAVESGNRREGKEAGLDDFIAKPFVSTNLYGTIQDWILKAREKKKQAVSAPDPASFFPQLNWQKALRHFGNNPSTYLKYIQKFATSYEHFESEFLEKWDSGKTDDARRCAHSLIGLASMIGAHELTATSRELESAILNEKARDEWNELFLKILSEIKAIEDGVRQFHKANG